MNAVQAIIDSIHDYLNNQPSCTEHDLIQHLQKAAISPFPDINLRNSKDLFSAHFLTRHALYQLQNRYLSEESFMLDLGMTEIARSQYAKGQTSLTSHDPVKEYYLDIKHYLETSEDEVNALLTRFWEKYLAHGSKDADLKVLELPENASHADVKKQFRLLAQKHHPDKGGCSEKFSTIKEAKDNLDKLFSQ